MEPRIQYAKTKDGVSIAYAVSGNGTPFVHMPMPLNHLQLGWQSPVLRPLYEQLAARYRFVQYDGRGQGLSQRGLTEYSLDACIRDLEAVVDRLQLGHFVLFASYFYAAAAVRYSVENPGRVAALVLWCGSANKRPIDMTVAVTLPEQNWQFYLQSVAQTMDWLEPPAVREYVDLLREAVSQADYLTILRGMMESDVEPLLPKLPTRTLVLHPRQLPVVPAEAAMQLASLIPNAQLSLLEGAISIPAGENTKAVLDAIDEFLGEGQEVAEAPEAGAFRTVLFTDVEGSTALTQRLGDAKARDLLREHERIVREALKAHGGAEVKTIGDGFMASFSSATRALECSIAMQRAFAAHNESAQEPILVRVGLNAGEPIAEEKDLYGTAVNLAARICGHAQAGQILASDVVRQLVAGKDFLFADRGEAALKGFDEPVRLYEVRWRDEG
jgi:class 3 adenylate cyclase/pimeloyl-ACP methyl ester carboxylesterase